MKDFSYITNSHPTFIENLYQQFLLNPDSIDADYKSFFAGFDFAQTQQPLASSASSQSTQAKTTSISGEFGGDIEKEFSVFQLIRSYRKKGHLLSTTNPIRPRKDRQASLDLVNFGLSENDLNTDFEAGKFVGLGKAKLADIIAFLKKAYCGSIGLDITAINYYEQTSWLQKNFEKKASEVFGYEKKKRILEKLNQAVLFEKFLHTKYVGQKRFSLEGGESTIPALDSVINVAAEIGVEQIVIGMAHRGRLNILANTMGKTYEQIFSEFEGKSVPDSTMGSGDVKYHLGFRSTLTAENGKKINVHLASNPSHLEAVAPVISGYSRCYADVLYQEQYEKVLPVIIHGDASVAGQGIVYELLQMSKLKGYTNHGSIHLVINNQIGFTTDFEDARSSDYCTSVASTVQAPVFHVNGDDIEAVVKCVEIALKYKHEFHSDVFIDIVCYRKHGHNEGDDPKFTQPYLYNLIEKHPNPREIYIQYLQTHGDTNIRELADSMEKKFWDDLQERLDGVKQHPLPYLKQSPEEWWKTLRKANSEDFQQSPPTNISEEQLDFLFDKIMSYPADFKPLKKVQKLLQDKIQAFKDEQKIDWASAELLAYGSLLVEGKDVRMSGEDVKRGTFSHRHLCIFEEDTNREYNRLNQLAPHQGKMRIFNSLLSEYAVLGFEYGYAVANPNNLTIWEAQFGDFVNGAQIIIDQFIAGGEEKWQQYNGIVMLLPHGYEGQGPEHSSARLERFLQMCAEENMVITNITTAANLFHAIRRQLHWEFRKPLINFSPKANLRLPLAHSHKTEFTQNQFQEIIDCPFSAPTDPAAITKVLFCTGKIYYDLFQYQTKENRADVAVIRLEQIYPLATNQLDALVQKYHNAIWYWVQEEPLNMGCVAFLQLHCKSFNYGIISRSASASTATGFAKVHAKEQEDIVYTAFTV